MNTENKRVIVLLFLIAFGLAACTNKKDDVSPQPANVQVHFNFLHHVGSQEIVFNTIQYTNAFGNLYSIETLKYFISDITFHRADGSMLILDEAHYVDAQDGTTLLFSPQTQILSGDYTSVSFIFGLNEEKNVNGRFLNPPESNMEWPLAMGPGYHYMKLEGKIDSTGVINNYQAHTGATMGNQNFIEIDLPNSTFNAGASGTTISIKMNINNWWVSPNTLDLNLMTMMMGNQEMQVKLHDNGEEDVFTIFSIE